MDFARATICCSPPLSAPAGSRSFGSRFGNISIVSIALFRIWASFIMRARERASPRCTHGRGSGEIRRVIAPISRFSRIVRLGNVLFVWGT